MKINKKVESQAFFLLIILQPILDIIAYFQYDNIIGSFAGYSRLLIMVLLPIYVLFTTKKKKGFLLFMSAIALYSILHMLNGFRVGYISMFQDLAYLARVIQMPILTVCFIYHMDHKHVYLTSKAYLVNCLIILFAIVVGHLTYSCPYTYVTQKIGLLGWFGNSNAQSIILACLIPLTIYFLIKKENKYLFFGGIIMTTFLLASNGTKGAYYSIFLIYIGYICFIIFEAILKKQSLSKYQFYVIFILLFGTITSVFIYPLTPRAVMDSQYNSAREKENEEMDSLTSKLTDKGGEKEFDVHDPEIYADIKEFYEPKLNKGLVEKFGIDRVLEAYNYLPDAYIVSDNRLVKRMYAQFIWEDSDFLTKLVGFEFTKIDDYDLENDFPAIFYYYGYIGFALYIGFLLYFAIILIKKVICDFKNSISLGNFSLLLTVCLLLGLAQYSGALLRRPNSSIYLSIVLALIYCQCKRSGEEKIGE